MYTIQKHKANEYILNSLKYDNNDDDKQNMRTWIEYSEGIPKIICNKSIHSNNSEGSHHSYSLEYMYWAGYHDVCKEMKNILKIYGIPNTRCPRHMHLLYVERYIYFPDIDQIFKIGLESSKDFDFRTCISHDNTYAFYMTIPNDEHKEESGLLFFMIDPLRAIDKMQYKLKNTNVDSFYEYYRNPIIDSFFEYCRNTIIKQDRDLLIKYILISHLTEEFIVIDIMHAIIDKIVDILLS